MPKKPPSVPPSKTSGGTGAVTPKPRKPRNFTITPRQRKFARLLVANDGLITRRQAAVEAGFPPSSAHTRSYEMMRNPRVLAEIARLRKEADDQFSVSLTRHMKDLHRLREQALAAGAYSASVAAEKLRGQVKGLYVSRSEIRHGSIDLMTREEVERELERYENERADRLHSIDGEFAVLNHDEEEAPEGETDPSLSAQGIGPVETDAGWDERGGADD